MMLSDVTFQEVVARASLAPSMHNIQPTRWAQVDGGLQLYCDTTLSLEHGDPDGFGAALSCGAAVEATVLALSSLGYRADVTLNEDVANDGGLRPIAHVSLDLGETADPLAEALEARYTWRGMFEQTRPAAWQQDDAIFVSERSDREWLAERNDWASFEIMQNSGFRHELLSWMRLSKSHPRYAFDGLAREAMGMSAAVSVMVRATLGPLWGAFNAFGRGRSLTDEAQATLSAPLIVLFHRASDENPVTSGRAYLRLCLNAAEYGLSAWPMAALSDHTKTQSQICARFGLPSDRHLVQAIRFGKPSGPQPPRARRPVSELIL